MNTGTLEFKPILEDASLVSESVMRLAQTLPLEKQPMVARIDPAYMGGKELCEHFGVDPNAGANCVIVEAVNSEGSTFVAVVVPVGYRADLNKAIRKHLNAKKVSLAPLESVLEQTGMEFGSITPFGLPAGWRILLDSRLMNQEKIIIGGGKQISKLLVATNVLSTLPNVEVLKGISNPMQAV